MAGFYEPRYIKNGAGMVLLSNRPVIVGGIILSAKAAAVSLSIYASATSVGVNATLARRMVIFSRGGTGSTIFNIPFLLGTGCSVSLSGNHGVATIMLGKRR